MIKELSFIKYNSLVGNFYTYTLNDVLTSSLKSFTTQHGVFYEINEFFLSYSPPLLARPRTAMMSLSSDARATRCP